LKWDAYSIFLHDVGHILGFRHEHAFFPTINRITNEKIDGNSQYSQNMRIVDTHSIMSCDYLQRFTKGSGKQAELSDADKLQAKAFYDDSYWKTINSRYSSTYNEEPKYWFAGDDDMVAVAETCAL